jgi:hypothetical protein
MFFGLPDPDPLVRGTDPDIRIRRSTPKRHGSPKLKLTVLRIKLQPDSRLWYFYLNLKIRFSKGYEERHTITGSVSI